MKLFLSDIAVLTSQDSPFSKLHVMIHLDHIQWNADKELLEWDMNLFPSIMYDVSTLPLNQNIEKTAEFVEKHKSKVIIEGACDEILSENSEKNDLTSPDDAEEYFNRTGVDIVVANLGTEHRASKSELKYRADLAQSIQNRIGARLCLHGTSSVSTEKLATLFKDGICKVNIWTILERESLHALFREMIMNVGKIIGQERSGKMIKDGLLGEKTDFLSYQSIEYFTSKYRREIVFQRM